MKILLDDTVPVTQERTKLILKLKVTHEKEEESRLTPGRKKQTREERTKTSSKRTPQDCMNYAVWPLDNQHSGKKEKQMRRETRFVRVGTRIMAVAREHESKKKIRSNWKRR
jgi:hypothetical protein